MLFAFTKSSPSIRGEHHRAVKQQFLLPLLQEQPHLQAWLRNPWDSPAKDHSLPGRLNIQRMDSGKQAFTAGHQLKEELWNLSAALQERLYEWPFIKLLWHRARGEHTNAGDTQSSPHCSQMALVAHLGLDRPREMPGSHTQMERWSALSLGKQLQSCWRIEFVTL